MFHLRAPLFAIATACTADPKSDAAPPVGDADPIDADTDTDTDADTETDTETDTDVGSDTGDPVAVCTVSTDGTAPYLDVQAAVDAGETDIVVCAGTYGPVSLVGHVGVVIAGVSALDVTLANPAGPALSASGSAFEVRSLRLTGYGRVDSAAGFDIHDSTAALTDLRIEGGTSEDLTVLHGAWLEASDSVLDGLVFTDNEVNGVNLQVDGGGTLILRHSWFTANRPHPVTGNYGNSLWVGEDVLGEVTNNLFFTSECGSPCYATVFDQDGLLVSHNVFYDLSGFAAVVLGEAPIFVNNIVQSNRALGARLEYTDPDRISEYNLFWDNQPNWDVAPGAGTLVADASFIDPAAGDFRLLAGSPAIDAGQPLELDPDGSPSDLGAYGGPHGVWP